MPCPAFRKDPPISNEVGKAADDELGPEVPTTDIAPKDVGNLRGK